jgi:Oxidoreductase family, NAD-binding Rossmann fold/Oxidoreductase family, C-terminal alpha/beta domain
MKSFPQSRREFLKRIGVLAATAPFVTSGALAGSANNTLRHASFGCGGMGLGDLKVIGNLKGVEMVALCDVDISRATEARQLFPNARFYQDWRELLEKEEKNIDSINVATPDHMHAPIAVTAMRMRKHVYGQKPLAHDVHEVRRMTEIAEKSKLVTQMGIQIHSAAQYRMAVRIVQDGAIGKVREVHTWCPKSWGDPDALPDRHDPVPANFNWDLWLGVCADRPFIGDAYYHPGNWRKRLDFGTGTLGDMGCHLFDPVFNALGLTTLLSVWSEGPPPNKWNWSLNGKVIYRFKGTPATASDVLPVTWYDGTSKPPAEIIALLGGDPLPDTGSVFVGTDGVMALPHIARPQLYPAAKFKDYQILELDDLNHWGQFVKACQGQGKTTADFTYAGPLTESILLGGIASRFPETTLNWNTKKMKFDLSDANAFLQRKYRKGWTIKGLS